MTKVLECRDLTAGYGDARVVRGIDIHLDAGEVVALLGPNGAGKTTTLLTMSGAISPIAGEVEVLGEMVKGGAPHRTARRGLALVPDDRSIFYGLSTWENLRLANRGRAKRAEIERVVDMFPALKPLLKRRAGLLSGGEQQMLALARALIAQPAILLIDEMSLGLAPVIVERLLPMVREIADSSGTAVLLVEQHVDAALSVADRAYVLNHGELVLEGVASTLSERRELLEASYMGEMTYEELSQ